MTIGASAWKDGRLAPAHEVVVPAFDRTLLYGLGAFETLRIHRGRPFLLERHLARLARSLGSLDLPVPPAVAGLEQGLAALAAADGTEAALARVTVTAGGVGHGDAPGTPAVVLARLRPLPVLPPAGQVRVGLVRGAQPGSSPLAGVKSTNYLEHYLLRERAEAGGRVDDLMVTAAGEVTEATVATVFVVRDGVLITPPLSAGVLEGVTRGVVLELAAERGLAVEQRPVLLDELAEVDELFLTGSGKGLLPVDELAGRALPGERPVSDALRAAFAELLERTQGPAGA